jgi:hypothetical protein
MNISLKLVTNQDEFDLWYNTFHTIFYKPEDNFPKELMKTWWPHNLCYLIYVNRVIAGFRFVGFREKYGAGMVYYGGLLEEYRYKGIYPKACDINEPELIERGLNMFVVECENPFKTKKTEDIARMNTFITKLDYKFISPEKIIYLRSYPPSPDIEDYKNQIQDGYLLGFKVLNESNLKSLKPNKGFVTKEEYRHLYFLENLLESDYQTLEDAQKERRSAREFISNLDGSKEDKFELITKHNWLEYMNQIDI